ncbi:hypothetical protein [Streptomyces sp. NPDC054961]
MFGLDGSFWSYANYLSGLHEGSGRTALAGFREWLVAHLGYGNNLVWEALVGSRMAFPDESVLPRFRSMTNEEDAATIGTLFDALERRQREVEEMLQSYRLFIDVGGNFKASTPSVP